MKTVHTNQPSSCPDRSINLKNPTYLSQHLLQTHNMDSKSITEKPVNGIDTKSEIKIETKQGCICPHCAKIIHIKKHLGGHIATVHSGGGQIRKPVSGQDSLIKQEGYKFICTLRNHNRTAHTLTPVKCHLCKRQCKSIDHFKEHYKREHYAKDPSAQIHHTPLDDSYGTPLDKFYELEPGASVRTVACVGLTLILLGLAGTLLLQLGKASSHLNEFKKFGS